MTRREHRLSDGRTLSWQETGKGPPLVLLHGWSLSGAVFAELAEFLDDFQLLCPDLPGHGRSTPPRAATLSSLAEDIAEWLPMAAPGPVLLGGWSLGGMVAMELASRTASPVAKLLLMSTTPRFTACAGWPHGLPATQVRVLRRNLERRFEATLGEFFALTFAEGEADAERLRAIRTFAVRPGGPPEPNSAAAFLGLLAEQEQRSLLHAIDCPTLVVHGTLDRLMPVEAGRVLAASLPNGQFYEVTVAGHAPFWTQPETVAQKIREFCLWAR